MNDNNEAMMADQEENTSGKGKFQELPGGVAGWSWGAFFWTWLWAIPNRTWIGLSPTVPVIVAVVLSILFPTSAGVSMLGATLVLVALLLAFAMHVMLGLNGRKWAWQNRQWDNVAHFKRVQSYWSFAALTAMALMVLIVVGATYSLFGSEDKLAKSITEARGTARNVGRYIEEHRKLPAQLEDAGVAPPYGDDIAAIALLPDGQLKVIPKSRPDHSFILSPSFNAQRQVEWRCLVGDLASFDMPKDCRFDTATQLRFP